MHVRWCFSLHLISCNFLGFFTSVFFLDNCHMLMLIWRKKSDLVKYFGVYFTFLMKLTYLKKIHNWLIRLTYIGYQVKKTFLKTDISTMIVFHWKFLTTYIFSVSLKFRVCYITRQWGKFTVKNATLYLQYIYFHGIYFLVICCCFSSKNLFLSFSLHFLIKHQISATNINQSETRIDDEILKPF